MPSIDELPPAPAAADADALAVSQNGVTRRLTRAQLLSGVQAQIAAAPGTLLGALPAGDGTPQAITIGANLSLRGATLSATASPYAVAALPAGQLPTAPDRVPLAQSGADVAVAYGQFMSGLSGLSGIDLSAHSVTPAGAPTTRSLAAQLSDAVAIEAFGAAGDGVTDDSAAFLAAIAAGRPVRLADRVYILNGAITLSANAVLLGTPGATILRRRQQSGAAAWITVTAPRLTVTGIIFDANGGGLTTDSPAVIVAPSCLSANFSHCAFINAIGPALGHGLAFQPSDPAATSHRIDSCAASGNAGHGIYAQAIDDLRITDCHLHDNGADGIRLEGTSSATLRNAAVTNNLCHGNQRGIVLGASGAGGIQGAIVTGNTCRNNAGAGIYAAGAALLIQGNALTGNPVALRAMLSAGRVAHNLAGNATTGIDAAGSAATSITGNTVFAAAIGVSAASAQGLRIEANDIQGCTSWAIRLRNIDPPAPGAIPGGPTSGVSISSNAITLATAAQGGIALLDAPQQVSIVRNAFTAAAAADPAMALWAHTDTALVTGNLWNGAANLPVAASLIGAGTRLAYADFTDAITVSGASAPVQSITGLHQLALAGGIGFIRVTAGGSGYTTANVTIAGIGSGATAQALVANGAVAGILLTAPGTGYDATTTAIITGDGTGATAAVTAGAPMPDGRQLAIFCATATQFAQVGSSPPQSNPSGTSFTAPSGTAVAWRAAAGTWQATQPGFADYVLPDGAGGVALRSNAAADISIHPNASGRLRLCSDTEAAGIACLIGRGSPQNAVSAPPGSDYRNLDGGAGNTFWIKGSGQGATGWIAVA